MKRIIYYVSITISLFLVKGCESLDLSPEDYYASGNFWQNESQVDGFVLGLHSDLRTAYSDMMFLLGEARGGTQKTGTGSQGSSLDYSSPIKNNAFTKETTGISNWLNLYSRILQTNLLIQELTEGTPFLSTESRNYYLGQAHGLRAFYYFYLYRTYGGVPIVDQVKVMSGRVEAKDLYQARATPKQTLDFIKEDIDKSETAFGNQTQMKNRKALWSQYATKMLKAEVYLWSAKVSTGDQTPAASDLATAESALNDIVASSNFQLLSSYKDVFAYNNKGNSEVIFAIRFADGEAGNFVHSFSYQIPIFINSFYDAEGELITTDLLDIKATVVQRHEYKPGLFHLYDDADERKRDIFLDYYLSDGSFAGTVVKKYNGTLNAQGNRAWSDDLVVYRYADVLLMMAEIQNMKGESVEPYINPVRERAYGESYDAELHGYTDGDFSTNELAILHERDKEFVLEGKRWFDIRRMQQTKDGQPLAFSAAANYDDPDPVISPSSPHLLLWPVDINTLNNDPELVQTEGYE